MNKINIHSKNDLKFVDLYFQWSWYSDCVIKIPHENVQQYTILNCGTRYLSAYAILLGVMGMDWHMKPRTSRSYGYGLTHETTDVSAYRAKTNIRDNRTWLLRSKVSVSFPIKIIRLESSTLYRLWNEILQH